MFETALNDHMNNFHPTTNFERANNKLCVECGKQCRSVRSLKRHVTAAHSNTGAITRQGRFTVVLEKIILQENNSRTFKVAVNNVSYTVAKM